ncbi:hypothetical protein J6590_077448 [Homalodisca vitripennis]|nr:hypothetical protein J6590_077448 [Homalodisca vitripennis]
MNFTPTSDLLLNTDVVLAPSPVLVNVPALDQLTLQSAVQSNLKDVETGQSQQFKLPEGILHESLNFNFEIIRTGQNTPFFFFYGAAYCHALRPQGPFAYPPETVLSTFKEQNRRFDFYVVVSCQASIKAHPKELTFQVLPASRNVITRYLKIIVIHSMSYHKVSGDDLPNSGISCPNVTTVCWDFLRLRRGLISHQSPGRVDCLLEERGRGRRLGAPGHSRFYSCRESTLEIIQEQQRRPPWALVLSPERESEWGGGGDKTRKSENPIVISLDLLLVTHIDVLHNG